MDWEKVAYTLVGFVGGLLANLLKVVMPSYAELFQENRDLREELRALEDTREDERPRDP